MSRSFSNGRGMTPFDPLDIASTPSGAPLVPPLPVRLRRTEILTIVYRTSRAAAASLIPQPPRLASDLCVLHVYHMHDAEWFGVYCESAWQIARRHRCGLCVATATMCWKQRAASGGELTRLVPGADVNVNPRVRQEEEGVVSRELVARGFDDVAEHESWVGPATLEVRANAQLPVHLLAVGEVVLGLHRMVDLTPSPGRVIHRYRAA